MPIYEYELCEGDCATCGGLFELRRPLNAAPLAACPMCQRAVRKVFGGSIHMPKHLKKPNLREAKEAGFTVLKRTSKGEYEVHRPSRNAPC